MRDSEREVLGDVAIMVGKVMLIFGLFIVIGRTAMYFCEDGCGFDPAYFIILPVGFGLFFYAVYKAILDSN